VWVSIRFSALRDLAYCAAKLGDVPLARSSIKNALGLWEGSKMGPSEVTGLPEWMSWARDYLARTEKGDVH
jgi:hypothetical protein